MKKFVKPVLWLLLIVAVGIQLFQIDKTNPPHDPATDLLATYNPPSEVAEIMKATCYDCHSNLTKFPWYTYIQPLGSWIKDHIEHGRKDLNFSIFTTYSEEDKPVIFKEMAKEVEKKKMPLKSYTYAHSNARLDDAQRKILVDWFSSQASNTGRPKS